MNSLRCSVRPTAPAKRRPPSPSPAHAQRTALRFVARLWLHQWRFFHTGVLLILLATGFDLCLPLAASRLVTAVVASEPDEASAWRAWGLLIGAFAAAAVLRNAAFRFLLVVAARNMQVIATATHAAIQRMSPQWHAQQHSGATVRRLGQGMWGYDGATDAIGLRIGPAVVVLLGLSALITWRLPCAGVWTLGVLALFAVLNLWAGTRYLRPANMLSNTLDARLNGVLGDALAGHATVRAFAGESHEAARMAKASICWRDGAMLTWRRYVDVGLAQSVLLGILLAGVTGAVIKAWTRGEADAGDVAFGIAAVLQMGVLLRSFGDDVRRLQKGLDDVTGMTRLTGSPELPRPVAIPLWREAQPSGDLVFENLTFGYDGDNGAPLYASLDLHIRAGETVLIVGATGSGKSTLVKLLQRQYKPHSGRILVGGVDIATLPIDVLRRSIAASSQDTGLLHRSIHDNIAYGRPDATREEVIEAARIAGAHAFIAGQAQGYDTIVDDRGACLSGGQVQRIALARALLPHAPILVLDEATSALDEVTEREILERLACHAAGQTRIVISHRPSPLLKPDRVLALHEGQLKAV